MATVLPKPGNPEGQVHIVQWASIEEEAGGTADYVGWLIGHRGYGAGDVLILSPRRLLAYKVRDALKSRGVAAHSFYHEEALEEDAAQETFALLTLLATPEDRVSLRFLLGFGSSTWLKGQYAKLRSYCEKNGISPRDALKSLATGEASLPNTQKLVDRYKAVASRLDALEGLSGENLANALFPDGVQETKALRDCVAPILVEDMQPSAMLERLRNLITQPELPEDTDFVRIMSLQKSKGLTSRIVIVLGCIAGLIPYVDPDETPAEQLEILREQRRLFYVAMTRPTDILVLSSFVAIDRHLAYKIGASTRFNMTLQAGTMASRFLAELGPTTPAAKIGTAWKADSYE